VGSQVVSLAPCRHNSPVHAPLLSLHRSRVTNQHGNQMHVPRDSRQAFRLALRLASPRHSRLTSQVCSPVHSLVITQAPSLVSGRHSSPARARLLSLHFTPARDQRLSQVHAPLLSPPQYRPVFQRASQQRSQPADPPCHPAPCHQPSLACNLLACRPRSQHNNQAAVPAVSQVLNLAHNQPRVQAVFRPVSPVVFQVRCQRCNPRTCPRLNRPADRRAARHRNQPVAPAANLPCSPRHIPVPNPRFSRPLNPQCCRVHCRQRSPPLHPPRVHHWGPVENGSV